MMILNRTWRLAALFSPYAYHYAYPTSTFLSRIILPEPPTKSLKLTIVSVCDRTRGKGDNTEMQNVESEYRRFRVTLDRVLSGLWEHGFGEATISVSTAKWHK